MNFDPSMTRALAEDRLEDALKLVDAPVRAKRGDHHLLELRGNIVRRLRLLRGLFEQERLFVDQLPENEHHQRMLIQTLVNAGLRDEANTAIAAAETVLGSLHWLLEAKEETQSPEAASIEARLADAVKLWREGRPDEARQKAESARYAMDGWRNPFTTIFHRMFIAAHLSKGEWLELADSVAPFAGDERFDDEHREQAVTRWMAVLPERVGWNFAASRTRGVDSRTAAMRTLGLIELLPPEAVSKRFDALAAEFPRSPMPYTHRAEMHLWFGNYVEAEADCRKALSLDPVFGRFAWIALGGALMWQGRIDEALTTLNEGAKYAGQGAPIHAFRGEAHWLRGDVTAAKRDLEMAVQRAPKRVSARLILALVAHAEGDETEVRAVHERFCRDLPDLARGARHELGNDTRVVEQEPATMAELLRCSLTMMRGNRSARRITWIPQDGMPRGVQPVAL